MVGGALLGLLVEWAGTAGWGGDTGGPVDVHRGRVEGDASWQQQPAGGDQVVQHLVAVGEVLPAAVDSMKKVPRSSGARNFQQAL